MTASVNTSAPTPPPASADSPRTLGVILLGRIALNLQTRFIDPFLPAIGRGLGVLLETASLLLTLRFLRLVVGAAAVARGRPGAECRGLRRRRGVGCTGSVAVGQGETPGQPG